MNPFESFANTPSIDEVTLIAEEPKNESATQVRSELVCSQPVVDSLEIRTLPEVRAALANTCRFFSESFKERFNIEKLKCYVNWGREKKAKDMLEKDPELLLKVEGVASDVFARPGMEKVNLTPFQIALCNGDVEMAEMMKPFFERLPDGLEKMQEQFDFIFPNGVNARVKEQEAGAFDFNEIAQAIIDAEPEHVQAALNKKDNNSDLCKALEKMREALVNQTSNELISNPFHLQNAFATYDSKYDKLNTDKKKDLFCVQVIGFAQSCLPASTLQAFTHGLYDIVENKARLVRSFNFTADFSLVRKLVVSVNRAGLGFDYWALSHGYAWRAPRCWQERGGLGGRDEWWRCLQNLCQTKTIRLGELMQTRAQQHSHPGQVAP